MTHTAQRCQLRFAAQPADAGYCPNTARWKVDVQLSSTTLAFSLLLCKTHLEALFDAVPGALSTGLPPAAVVDAVGPGNSLMFPVTSCQANLGVVPAHEHGDDENWVLGELVEEVALGSGIYRAGDGSLHLVRTAAGIHVQPLTPQPAP